MTLRVLLLNNSNFLMKLKVKGYITCYNSEKKHVCFIISNIDIFITVNAETFSYISLAVALLLSLIILFFTITVLYTIWLCSNLTTSLVNVSLEFRALISNISQYLLLKKCEKLLQCKSFSYFFNKKYQCIWL